MKLKINFKSNFLLKIEKYYYLYNNGTLLNKTKFMKNENPKISIISLIYNREKFFLRFLRSIQNQYFDLIEKVLINRWLHPK